MGACGFSWILEYKDVCFDAEASENVNGFRFLSQLINCGLHVHVHVLSCTCIKASAHESVTNLINTRDANIEFCKILHKKKK